MTAEDFRLHVEWGTFTLLPMRPCVAQLRRVHVTPLRK